MHFFFLFGKNKEINENRRGLSCKITQIHARFIISLAATARYTKYFIKKKTYYVI